MELGEEVAEDGAVLGEVDGTVGKVGKTGFHPLVDVLAGGLARQLVIDIDEPAQAEVALLVGGEPVEHGLVGVGVTVADRLLAAKDGGTGNTGAGAAGAEAAEAWASGARVAAVDLEGEGVGHGELFFMRPRTAATGTG